MEDFPGLTAPRRTVVKNLLRARWEMLTSDIQLAGYVLDPEFLLHDVTANRVSFYIGHCLCADPVVVALRVALTLLLMQEVMEGFMNILEKVFRDDPQAQAKALGQLQQFRTMQGLFGRPAARLAADEMAAHAWWNIYGAYTPELQKLAIQVSSQVHFLVALGCYMSGESLTCQSLTAQCLINEPICRSHQPAHVRGIGLPTTTHNKKRNRLHAGRAEKLFNVFSNLRFLKRAQRIDFVEQVWSWET